MINGSHLEPMSEYSYAAFVRVKPVNASKALMNALGSAHQFAWLSQTFGTHPVAGYIEAGSFRELCDKIEEMREVPEVAELESMMCKHIPGDEFLEPFSVNGPETALLLISVNYLVEKERVVTENLRKLDQVTFARAMWGTTDIVALVEADDPDAMRDLICDSIKVMPGVKGNVTLYCYPNSCE